MPADAMRYPQVLSGVWVTGFEESSFFPGDTTIPGRNDPRRYRLELLPSREQVDRFRDQTPKRGYAAFSITFLGRRTKHPVNIDCEGAHSYFFIPDWIIRTRYLGPIADPDFPVPNHEPYKPFKRSGEGGVIRQIEDEALARCGGTRPGPALPHNSQ
jgi:hypothetical protein